MSVPRGFQRVNARRRCPVCGRADWCLIHTDPVPLYAVCPRVDSPKRLGDAGYLHELVPGAVMPPAVQQDPMPAPSFGRLAAKLERAANLEELAEAFGLAPESLRRLRVGWRAEESCSTWPMQDAGGRIIGLQRRWPDRRSGPKVMDGHRAGLFVPRGLERGQPLVITEGPTDCAAALELGVQAVGRFSCSHGAWHLRRLIRRLKPPALCIVSDADEPGRNGSARLAAELADMCPLLLTAEPPRPHKDLRAWRAAGAGPAELRQLLIEVKNGQPTTAAG
jgi:hypothetical protein